MASINKKIRQSKENQKETNTIAQILEKQGYDEVLVALGKDGAMVLPLKVKTRIHLISCTNFSIICVMQTN